MWAGRVPNSYAAIFCGPARIVRTGVRFYSINPETVIRRSEGDRRGRLIYPLFLGNGLRGFWRFFVTQLDRGCPNVDFGIALTRGFRGIDAYLCCLCFFVEHGGTGEFRFEVINPCGVIETMASLTTFSKGLHPPGDICIPNPHEKVGAGALPLRSPRNIGELQALDEARRPGNFFEVARNGIEDGGMVTSRLGEFSFCRNSRREWTYELVVAILHVSAPKRVIAPLFPVVAHVAAFYLEAIAADTGRGIFGRPFIGLEQGVHEDRIGGVFIGFNTDLQTVTGDRQVGWDGFPRGVQSSWRWNA